MSNPEEVENNLASPPSRDRDDEKTTSVLDSQTLHEIDTDTLLYRNNLLPAVGFLDLTNALDFPANVWNSNPLPLFVKVLMGLGGSIAILSTSFAVWDLWRARRNIQVLRDERAYLKHNRRDGASALEEAWLHINYRELGWEIVDRMLLDVFMGIAGILVGTGCIMAIRGNIPKVFLASNILSGYLGNSFVAAYAILSASWSFYMWRKARMIELAVSRARSEIDDPKILAGLQKHTARHKLYAAVTGITIIVSGVGSEVSSTMWQGYVVLIPCIVGSVFSNLFWRFCLGYDRMSLENRAFTRRHDLQDCIRVVIALQDALKRPDTRPDGVFTAVLATVRGDPGLVARELVNDFGLRLQYDTELQNFQAQSETETTDDDEAVLVHTFEGCMQSVTIQRLHYEERFLIELFGYYLLEAQRAKEQKAERGPSSDEMRELPAASTAD